MGWAKIPNIENFQINIMSDEEAILEYVKKHGYIKNSECQKLLNINSNKAQYMLQKMKEEKILQHVGSRKTSKYMLP